MPTTMIHEKIAYDLARKYPELDTSDFYLGILAPDTPNLHGFAPKEMRWTAHLRDSDLSIWKDNIKRFYKETSTYPKNFLIGYCLHIYTDIIVDEKFYLPVTSKIKESDSHQRYLLDMDYYGHNLKESNFFKEIKSKLEETSSYDIRNISAKDLTLFKEQFLSKTYPNEEPKYITDELIKEIDSEIEKEYLSLR